MTVVSVQSAVADETIFTVDLRACSAIKKIAERVSCYDELAEIQASKSEPTLNANAATTLENNSNLETNQFGLEKKEIKSQSSEELIARVVESKEISPNKRLITLANGQVWRQMLAENFLIRPNDSVRIYKKSSKRYFRLSVEGRSKFIQVQRVK